MRVPPHPHTGLQTVTWLVSGEVLHRDNLGSLATIRPGEVNLMTSGRGIAHSEESPSPHPAVMHGLQLWVAMPDGARHDPPRFEHHADLPVLEVGGLAVTVVVGALGSALSPALVHTPLLGAEVVVPAGAADRLPVAPDFEHAALVLDGSAKVAGSSLAPGSLLYLGIGRTELSIHSGQGGRLFLLGGKPFDEPLVMWWNFVARTHEEIVAAREDWMAGRRFGTVIGYAGEALPAPEMPTTRLKARDRNGQTIG
jgi:redox-sensitive bicupin YhaK (pirin superfamily)